MKKLSIIVPAYNIEQYIGKCIDSLAQQTLQNIEIIIINDGSTDKTEEIINKKINQYADKDITLYNKKNGGMSDARNYGLSKSNGEYIAFVDGDDYVESDMFTKMYEKTNEYKYDIVVCDVNCRYPNKDIEIKSGVICDKKNMNILDKKELLLSTYVVVWNKIYKRDLFTQDKLFMKGIYYEDVLFLYKLYPFIDSIGVVNEKLYNYIQRQNSVTYTYNEKLYDIVTVLKELRNYYINKNLKDDYSDILEYIYVRYLFATFIKRLAKCKDKKKFKEGVNYVIQNVKEVYPNYKNNIFIKKKNGKSLYLRCFNRKIANIIYYVEKNRMN